MFLGCVTRRLGLALSLGLASPTVLPAQQPQPAPPLYVVDGFWFPHGTPEAFFTPAEILSASVYKDAAAMRQRYGAAATDGVLELKLSTPFLLNNHLLRTPQAKDRVLRHLATRRVSSVRRLSAAESRPYVGPSGQTVLVLTLEH